MNHDPYRSILLFGPPGSGKGTLGKVLALAASHVHLSSGDLFRGLSTDSRAGKLYLSYAHKGQLVPDEVTIQLWQEYVEQLIASKRYLPSKQLLLLDGIPRTLGQAKLLENQIKIIHIIVLNVEDPEILINRLKRRAHLEGRHDDVEEKVLRTRMDVYQKETKQLLSHYPSSLISHFNANQRPIEVLRDVLVKLISIL